MRAAVTTVLSVLLSALFLSGCSESVNYDIEEVAPTEFLSGEEEPCEDETCTDHEHDHEDEAVHAGTDEIVTGVIGGTIDADGNTGWPADSFDLVMRYLGRTHVDPGHALDAPEETVRGLRVVERSPGGGEATKLEGSLELGSSLGTVSFRKGG